MAFTGDPDDFTTSDDAFRMGSQAATHWDALGHVGYAGRLWNDTPMDVVDADGNVVDAWEYYRESGELSPAG